MNCLRALFLLAEDAIDALIHWVDFSSIADRLWAEASVRDAAERLAEREAEEEVSEPTIVTGSGSDSVWTYNPVDAATAAAIQALNDSLWPWGRNYDGRPDAERARRNQSSPAARAVNADTAAGESPAVPSPSPSDVAAAGHPNLKRWHLEHAAYLMRQQGVHILADIFEREASAM